MPQNGKKRRKTATRQVAAYLITHNPLFGRCYLDRLTASIETWHIAWQAHPSYGTKFFDATLGLEPHNPVVMLACQHEPGAGGRTESYLIGPLMDVTSPKQLEWCRRTIGEPHQIRPVTRVTPVNPSRLLAESYSYKGAGMAWRSRMALKLALPRRFHRLVSKARHINRRPKYAYLQAEVSPEEWTAYLHRKDEGSTYQVPEWYSAHTKAELFVMYDVPADLADYIDPMDFWRCATGRIRPEDVPELVNHQPILFELEEDK